MKSTPRVRVQPPARLDRFVPIALAAASLLLGSWQLGSKDLWLDEAFSWTDISLTWSALLARVGAGDTHQALYFVLLKLWTVFGHGEAVLRVPSVLFSATLAPLVWWIGHHVIDRDGALIAALLMLLHPFALEYAQEARGYALAAALAALASLCLIRMLRHPSPARGFSYAMVAGLLVWTQLHAAAMLAVHAVVIAVAVRHQRGSWKRLSIAWSAAVVIASPAVLLALGSPRGLIDWVDPLSLEQLHALMTTLSGSTGLVGIAFWGAAAAVGGWSVLRSGDGQTRTAAIGVLLWALLPICAVIALSALRPMLVPRYLLFSLPAVCLLVASGLSALRRRQAVIAVAALMMAGEIYGVHQWFVSTPKEQWRQAAQEIVRFAQEGDAVTSYAWFGLEPLNYYRQQLNANYPLVDLASGPYERGSSQPSPHAGKVHDLALTHPRVWVVLNHLRARGGGISPNLATLERLMRQRYRLVTAQTYFGLVVQLWERRELP